MRRRQIYRLALPHTPLTTSVCSSLDTETLSAPFNALRAGVGGRSKHITNVRACSTDAPLQGAPLNQAKKKRPVMLLKGLYYPPGRPTNLSLLLLLSKPGPGGVPSEMPLKGLYPRKGS